MTGFQVMDTLGIQILGTGKYLPSHTLSDVEIAQQLGISAAWVQQRVGVRQRHFAMTETAVEMGSKAARAALAAANLQLTDISCIVSTSGIPQQSIPCNAALIQRELGGGNSGIPAFDINSTCLSFLVGLETMAYPILAGKYDRVLLVATEVISKGINWQDPESATLFGDAAAAVIVGRTPIASGTALGIIGAGSKILASRFETYGKGAELTKCKGGGNQYSPSEYCENPDSFLFKMDGRGVYKLAAKIFPGFLERLLSPIGLSIEDMDLVIPHQASFMAIELIGKQLRIPKEKLMVIIQDHGNNIAASIPLALHIAISEKRLQRGQRVLMLGTSAGFSIGGMVLDY
jgi:3-oxoacyl-[acyl-carrier-protein] synthase III